MEKFTINDVGDLPKESFTMDDTVGFGPVYRKIIQLHTIGNNEPSGSKSYSRSIYPGGSRKNNFPLRRDVGEQIFSDKDKSTVAEFYLACVAHVQNFKACNPETKNWSIKGDIALEHLLVQSFFTWVLSCDKPKNFRNKKFLKEKGAEGSSDSSEAKAMITENSGGNQAAEILSGKVPISKQQKIRIIKQLIRINFPQQMKIWPLVFKTLSIFGTLLEDFIDEIGKISAEGDISFSTLDFCLSSSPIARCLGTPNFIIQALLLGPLKGLAVESFLSEKPAYFREEAKQLLENAEGWTLNRADFEAAVVKYTHKLADDGNASSLLLSHYSHTSLVEVLCVICVGVVLDNVAESSMSISYAYSTLKHVARKAYVENVFLREQLDDVFHSIICQHPSVKHFVVKMLRNVYNDEKAANRWQKFGPQFHNRCKMSSVFEKIDYHEVPKPGCLRLDENVEVFVIDTSCFGLKILENEIAHCEENDFPCIGLDSEWNPFLAPSKAALLQVAFQKSVYLVDLEALRTAPFLARVLDKLFFGKALKIGFQFADDLVSIRQSVPMCEALYKPENLICVEKLIAQLVAQSKVTSHLLIEEFFPKVAEGDDCGAVLVDENEDTKSCVTNLTLDNLSGDCDPLLVKTSDCVDSKAEITKNIGLSMVCRRMLGLGLEKSEQCSIWDRRPLRYRQIRYAAIDAWCCLKLYQKCVEWSQKLGCNIKELALAQGNIRCQLPLFWKPYQ